jgi:hypothetical protein
VIAIKNQINKKRNDRLKNKEGKPENLKSLLSKKRGRTLLFWPAKSSGITLLRASTPLESVCDLQKLAIIRAIGSQD